MPEIIPPFGPNGPNSAGISPEDLAWQAAGGADEAKRLEAQVRQLQQRLALVPEPTQKGLLWSSTFWSGLGLAAFAIADSTQPVWFPFVAVYVPANIGYLSGNTAINVSLKLAGHILPVLLFLAGIIQGRKKAGGIRGWL